MFPFGLSSFRAHHWSEHRGECCPLHWAKVKIVFRGASGFCRWRMLGWCERHSVDYIVGIARNPSLRELARAYVGTIRLKLLKIGAGVLRNTRRVRLLLSNSCPHQALFFAAAARLRPG